MVSIIETCTHLISNVGFPIAMCGGLLWYLNKIVEAHKTETAEMTKAVNGLSILIQKLCDSLDVVAEKEEETNYEA